ncbi:MAG TPA: Yip1 family protein [Candidatus Brocadiia bacterium]|nr:Yip1 family protein [Candidatus Brocadiia bacterium]
MFDLIRGVITRPADTFRELLDRATPRHAAALLAAAWVLGLFSTLLENHGAGLFAAFASIRLVSYAGVWLVVGLGAGFIATRFMQGAGAPAQTLTAAGFAATPLAILFIIEDVMFLMGQRPGAVFFLFFVAWSILLLYIGVREVHDISSGSVVIAIAPPLLLAFGVLTARFCADSYVACFSPFMSERPSAVASWQELPPDARQVVRDPGFDEPPAADMPTPPEPLVPLAKDWMSAGFTMFRFICRPEHTREASDGGYAARLAIAGLPQSYALSLVEQDIPKLGENAFVYVSVRAKGRGVVAARAALSFLSGDPARAACHATLPIAIASGDSAWTEYRVKGQAPAKTAFARIQVFLQASGELWVDDVKVYVSAPEEKTPAASAKAEEDKTLATAPDRAVAKLAASGAFKDSPVVFVAAVRDRTAARLDTPALRKSLSDALARAGATMVPPDREAAAGLNDLDLSPGAPLAPAARHAAAKAGASRLVTSEIAAPSAERWTFNVHMADAVSAGALTTVSVDVTPVTP